MGELMVSDRFINIFQGGAPRSVLARFYTGRGSPKTQADVRLLEISSEYITDYEDKVNE